MGAWGTAIFSDDLAADVRREYGALLSVGCSDEEAEELIQEYYGEILGRGDPDEAVFWFALALAEWKKGRLSEKVKKKALDWLDDGSDLERWKTSPKYEPDYRKRKAVLEEFRKTLLSEQPERKKVRKPSVRKCPWKAGSLLGYHVITGEDIKNDEIYGKYALIRIIKINQNPVSRILPEKYFDEYMLVGLYDWLGDKPPTEESVEGRSFVRIDPDPDDPEERERLEKFFDQLYLPEKYKKMTKEITNNMFGGRANTCYHLDWKFPKGLTDEVFTYLSRDKSYEEKTPEYFDTDITSYTMGSINTFDWTIRNTFYGRPPKKRRSFVQ